MRRPHRPGDMRWGPSMILIDPCQVITHADAKARTDHLVAIFWPTVMKSALGM